ncbi:hypothetical protein MLD38_019324 [Melastoma candidum]|uniref:Uncharacterized protein n=1 Tax=Melastoma candidum TaxID=119954 RepID=A0ACB9QWM8_9MYRT|nr:hypothetical protein MLD38_019324 [Melastoma candidum]
MMTVVSGIFHERYRNTCAELKRLVERVGPDTLPEFSWSIIEEYGHGLEPGNDNRDAGRSVLLDSCQLDNLLTSSERKWEVICGVWAELLSYTAGHCQAVSHARLVSEGGEFVWLLMAHLDMVPRFPKN